MKRILFLTTYASPYRVRFFDELGKTAQVTVLYSRPCADVSHRDAKWFEPGQGGFRSVQLKTTCTLKGKQLCFDVCKWLKKGEYDAIFVGGYSSPTAILAMLYMRLHGIPFTMEVDGGLIRPDGRLKFACKRFLVRLANCWLSTGKETTKYLVHRRNPADPSPGRQACCQADFKRGAELPGKGPVFPAPGHPGDGRNGRRQ